MVYRRMRMCKMMHARTFQRLIAQIHPEEYTTVHEAGVTPSDYFVLSRLLEFGAHFTDLTIEFRNNVLKCVDRNTPPGRGFWFPLRICEA